MTKVEQSRNRARARSKKHYKAHREETLAKCRVFYQNNRKAIRERSKAHYHANKHKESFKYIRWQASLLYNYNITPDYYFYLFDKNDGCCHICDKHYSLNDGKLAVDHCHKTGKVRGMLCDACNMALGLMEDNAARLNSASDYIKTN